MGRPSTISPFSPSFADDVQPTYSGGMVSTMHSWGDASSAEYSESRGHSILHGLSSPNLFVRGHSMAATEAPFNTDDMIAQDWVSAIFPTPGSVAATAHPSSSLQANSTSTNSVSQGTAPLQVDGWPASTSLQTSTSNNSNSNNGATMNRTQPGPDVQRLRKRKAESDAENTRLCEAIFDVRAALTRADDVVEDALEMSSYFPPRLFGKLSELSDQIAWMKKRLS